MEYLTILLLLFIITFLLEITFKIHLYHNLVERLIITSIFFIIGVVWDTFAITQGHWFFPQDKILGITIGAMPLEEYLFILIIPYSVLTVYKIIDSKFIKRGTLNSKSGLKKAELKLRR